MTQIAAVTTLNRESDCRFSTNAEVDQFYQQRSRECNALQECVADGDEEATRRGWQKDYFQGRDPGEQRFDYHQTKLGLKEFQIDR